MEIPTEKDWGFWQDGLDLEYAHKHFSGKSISEAIELFVDHSLYYQEDLMWMPAVPFQYYIHAYKEYILSDRSKDDSDGASCYLGLIGFKLKTNPEHIISIFELLLPSAKTVAGRQEFYDANVEIYGDFKEILVSIIRQSEELILKNTKP